MKKIIHERDKCIGCGACASVCPEIFEMSGKDGLAVLKNSQEKNGVFELEIEELRCAKEAADVCPIRIIKIEN
ncbi:MAG: ferredoxin [Patescibacteria group bacterium]